MAELIFLKFGGSLITNKNIPHSPNTAIIHQIAVEIAELLKEEKDLRLLLGHGSGSFGHVPARAYGTREGVKTPDQWKGFTTVWAEARALNQIIIDEMLAAGIPVISFPPSSSVTTNFGKITEWSISPIEQALKNHLIPVVYGDVVFDEQIGGTILSTEDLFSYLAALLKPKRILLAGLEEGVWKDYPQRTTLISSITPINFPSVKSLLGGSAGVDVTGGMLTKVESMLKLVDCTWTETVQIFSALNPGSIRKAYSDLSFGTTLHK